MSPLRMVIHAHSEWSYDGSWSLSALARLFGRLGVDVLLMSEHDDGFSQQRFDDYRAACAAASTSRCRLVPGIEYSDPDNAVHILTWGTETFFGEHRPVMETLADVAAAGGVSIFAHPHRRDVWRHYDNRWTSLLSGVEIWNRKTDGLAPGSEALALARSTGLPPLVGIDFHRLNQLYPLHHTVAGQDGRAETSAITALRNGRATPAVFGLTLQGMDGECRPSLLGPLRRMERMRRSLKRVRKAIVGR